MSDLCKKAEEAKTRRDQHRVTQKAADEKRRKAREKYERENPDALRYNQPLAEMQGHRDTPSWD